MPRLRFVLVIAPMFVLLAACAALGSDETGGAGGSSGDPKAIEKEILLGCSNNLEPAFHAELPWKLTVDPTRITSEETFGAELVGLAVLDEATLDAAQLHPVIPHGFKRARVDRLRATVRVRDGAVGPDVVLEMVPIPRTCTYDDSGNTGVDAGPGFPPCSEENDNPEDGSNNDCTGLGGVPSPENPCGQFVPIDTSTDCLEGGLCLTLDKPTAKDECDKNGFCVTGPVELPLKGSVGLNGFRAAVSGSVLFGWDDQEETTGVEELKDEDDCNFGTWVLPKPVHESPGPNAMRINIGGLPLALECVMAVPSRFEDGVMSCDPLTSPTPDHRLIAFPIQER